MKNEKENMNGDKPVVSPSEIDLADGFKYLKDFFNFSDRRLMQIILVLLVAVLAHNFYLQSKLISAVEDAENAAWSAYNQAEKAADYSYKVYKKVK